MAMPSRRPVATGWRRGLTSVQTQVTGMDTRVPGEEHSHVNRVVAFTRSPRAYCRMAT